MVETLVGVSTGMRWHQVSANSAICSICYFLTMLSRTPDAFNPSKPGLASLSSFDSSLILLQRTSWSLFLLTTIRDRRVNFGPSGADEQEINCSCKRIYDQYYPTVFVLYFFSLSPLSLCFIPISLDFHLDIVGLSEVEITFTKFLFLFWWNRNKDPSGRFPPVYYYI